MEKKTEHMNNSKSCDDRDVINVKQLSVWTREEKSWWRRKVTKPKTVILNNVTGNIKDGDFTVVLGPSGAGKTTFLACLAGKCTLPSSGVVTVKGTNVRRSGSLVEIVPQTEVFMDNSTVKEHLVFMTEMKLGSCKTPDNSEILDAVLNQLKLEPLAHTQIHALSGGEKRLLSLATSLLSRPQILICDEPTTGLDSYNAALVVGVLKKLSLSGKTVISSVHQPSSDLFREFSSVMLMAEGRLLFQGSLEECKNKFKCLNLQCPKNYNPAEFYIRAVSNANGHYADKIMEMVDDVPMLHECDPTVTVNLESQLKTTKRNWFKQVQLLLWRSSLAMSRDIRTHLFQLIFCMTMSSIIIGTCYIGISGTSQRGVQDLRGFLWLMCSEVSFGMSYSALHAFGAELTLFRREVGIYSVTAYFVARFLTFVPRCVILPISFVAITTVAVELPNYIITALEFVAALIVTAVASTAYGLGMGAMFVSSGLMTDVMSCADLPLFLMSGAFLRISSLPLWLYPLKYVSHFYYGMDALSNIYWRQIDRIECPANSTTTCLTDGISVLLENGYASDFVVQDSLGLLFVTAIWSLLGYCGLKREEKKGYAY